MGIFLSEIILDASATDEGRLVDIHKLGHSGRQPRREDFGQEPRKTMYEADRPEVLDVRRGILLRQQSDQRFVERAEVLIPAGPHRTQGGVRVGDALILTKPLGTATNS